MKLDDGKLAVVLSHGLRKRVAGTLNLTVSDVDCAAAKAPHAQGCKHRHQRGCEAPGVTCEDKGSEGDQSSKHGGKHSRCGSQQYEKQMCLPKLPVREN